MAVRHGKLLVSSALLAGLIASSSLQLVAQTSSNNSGLIVSARPLRDLAEELRRNYAKVVTFEDPAVSWPGEPEMTSKNPNATVHVFLPKRAQFYLACGSGIRAEGRNGPSESSGRISPADGWPSLPNPGIENRFAHRALSST